MKTARELAQDFQSSNTALDGNDLNYIASLIQQAIDQARLEGARKMQVAAADEVDSNIGSIVTTGIRCAKFIRALSPEAICGGE